MDGMNWAGYSMTHCPTAKPARDVCCAFAYRGFKISLTTYGGDNRGNPVAIFNDLNDHVGDAESVELAILQVDKLFKRAERARRYHNLVTTANKGGDS